MTLWGRDLWKFSNSLTSNTEYVQKMKSVIFETVYA